MKRSLRKDTPWGEGRRTKSSFQPISEPNHSCERHHGRMAASDLPWLDNAMRTFLKGDSQSARPRLQDFAVMGLGNAGPNAECQEMIPFTIQYGGTSVRGYHS